MSCFENAVQNHLKTIANRDLQGFSQYLHPDHHCIIILPNGNMIEGYEDIVSFHGDWFADTDWHMDTKVMDIFANDDMGYALLDVIYHDLDEFGKPYEMKYLLSLLFVKVDDNWILIRDQNTMK